MAKPEAGEPGDRRYPEWMWPGLAFATIALFMGYLWWASREAQVVIREEASGRPQATATAAEFATAPARYSGRVVRLDTVTVVERLGRAAFEIELPNRPPYPVVLERHLMEADVQVTSQDRVNLVGSVYALNDSIIATWGARGILDPARTESLADDSTFLLADSVELLLPEEPAQPSPPPAPGP